MRLVICKVCFRNIRITRMEDFFVHIRRKHIGISEVHYDHDTDTFIGDGRVVGEVLY